jgi:hypothetical protein
MRISSLLLAIALVGLSSSASAQRGPPKPASSSAGADTASAPNSTAKRNHLTLSVSPFGLSVGYAGQAGGRNLTGLECGLGSDCLFSEGILSSHAFAQPFFGGDTGREWPENYGFAEIIHLNLFYRYAPAGRWYADCGLRASGWVSGVAAGPSPSFIGVYIAPTARWRWIRCGPRLMLGRFSYTHESGDGTPSGEHSLAIVAVPLAARIEFTKSW